MKAILALGLLCATATSLSSKSVPPKVRTASHVPSVTIALTGQTDAEFKFAIRNDSGHGITAFGILLVPHGVPEKNGHFLCKGKCSPSYGVDDIDHPAISDGSVIDVKYEAAKVSGGAVIVESAVFDDGSYAGNERLAAYLVAQQLGNQAEFDRIVPAVAEIMGGSGAQGATKVDRINAKLGSLPVAVDSATTAAFYRWFPNLQDCQHRFPEIIKSASSQEKSDVEAKLQPLLASGDTSDHDLAKWWTATEKSLAHLGCSGCGDKLASPSPPVTTRTVSLGCSSSGEAPAPDGVWLTVELVDDSPTGEDSSGDDADQAAANSDDSGQTAENAKATSATDQAATNSASKDSASNDSLARVPAPPLVKVIPPAPAVAEKKPVPVVPRFQPVFLEGAVSFELRSAPRESLRTLPDEAVYHNYFYYVVAWSHYLSSGGTLDVAADLVHSPYPFPPEMKTSEQNVVMQAAFHCADALGKFMSQLKPEEVGVQFSGREADLWRPVPPETQRQRDLGDRAADGRSAIVKQHVEQLRSKVDKIIFHDLDQYVHQLYQASPGRLVREPLTEDRMVGNYLRYIGWLDSSMVRTNANLREVLQTRKSEQKVSGLNDDDELIVQRVADDLWQKVRDRRSDRLKAAAATGVVSVAAVEPGLEIEIGNITRGHVLQLKSALLHASYKKVAQRVQELYCSLTVTRVIPVTDAEPKSKTTPELAGNRH